MKRNNFRNVTMWDLARFIDQGYSHAQIAKKIGVSRSAVTRKFTRYRKKDDKIMTQQEPMPDSNKQKVLEFLEFHPELETFTAKTLGLLTGIKFVSSYLSVLAKEGFLIYQRKTGPDGLSSYHEYSNPFTNNPPSEKAQQLKQQLLSREEKNGKHEPDFQYVWDQCVDLREGTFGKNGYGDYVIRRLAIFRQFPEQLFGLAKRKWERIYPGLPCPFDADFVQEENVPGNIIDVPAYLNVIYESIQDLRRELEKPSALHERLNWVYEHLMAQHKDLMDSLKNLTMNGKEENHGDSDKPLLDLAILLLKKHYQIK